MKVLVTGGAGYIGSHTVVDLLDNDFEVVVVDNLCNSKPAVVERVKKISGKDFKFYQNDVCDENAIDEIFDKEKPDAVIHFAGLKAVGESCHKPLEYYRNNLISTLLLQHCRRNSGTKGGDYAASSYYVGIALHDDMPRRSAPKAIRASFRYTRCRRQYRKTTNRIHRPYSVFDCQYQIAPNGQIYLCLNTNYRLRSRRRQYKYRL